MTSPLRRSLELKAGPLFLLLARLPRVVPFLVVFGLLIGGLLLQGVLAVALLAVVFVLFGLLLFFAWPVLAPPQRAIRLGVLALLVYAAVTRA